MTAASARILIIEDEPDTRSNLIDILKDKFLAADKHIEFDTNILWKYSDWAERTKE